MKEPLFPGFWSPRSFRLWTSLLLMLVTTSLGTMSSTLSLAIVCMVPASPSGRGLNSSSVPITNLTTLPAPTFDWSSSSQALLHSAFFWGSFAATPLAILVDKFGCRPFIAAALAVSVLGSVLSPLTALRAGLPGLFSLRFLIGMGYGLLMPSASGILARWYPPSERGTALAIHSCGNQLGELFVSPTTGQHCIRPLPSSAHRILHLPD